MKTNIEYILQIEGQNLLQVHYTSGTNRFVKPDSWGCYGSNMTKSQLNYMNNAKMYEMRNANGFCESNYYYLLENSPLIETIERRNEREEKSK